jgi:hypothetical protein
MVESMLESRLSFLKPSNSSTMNPNTTWSGSFESYHPYLPPQKVSKNPQTYCIHSTLSKTEKTILVAFVFLGINYATNKIHAIGFEY